MELVLFNEVLDHVLRIDRVFRQVQGHMLLIGASGAGKTTLTRFVAWMNGISVFQIKVHSRYSGADFEEDLRTVLRRAGCKGEKVCFVMDSRTSGLVVPGAPEHAAGEREVPACSRATVQRADDAVREGRSGTGSCWTRPRAGDWFTKQIMRNLHVIHVNRRRMA